MIRPEVKTWIGGATVVVAFNPEHYIEAGEHQNAPDHQYIQVVRDGQVYLTRWVLTEAAPEFIINLMRNYARYGTCDIEEWRLAA